MPSLLVAFISMCEICGFAAVVTGFADFNYLPFSATWTGLVFLKVIVVFSYPFPTILRAISVAAAIIVWTAFILCCATQDFLFHIPKGF